MLVMLGSKYFLSQHHDIELELAKGYVVSYVVVYCQLEIPLRGSLNVKLTTLGADLWKRMVHGSIKEKKSDFSVSRSNRDLDGNR